MKKFTSILATAVVATFGVNAQELTPEPMELANPSFEEVAEGADAATEAEHIYGWTMAAGSNPAFSGKSQKSMPTYSSGSWYVRCVMTSGGVEPGTIIYQNVASKGKPGTYVVTAMVNVSRNSQRGDIDGLANGNIYGILYAMDDDGELAADYKGVTKITECLTNRYKAAAILVSDYDDEGDIQVGFGLPSWCDGNPKGWFELDNVTLTYFDTLDKDAVISYLKANDPELITTGLVGNASAAAVEGIEVAPVQDNNYYNLQGIKVAEPATSGIYIHNGKKIVVRK